MNHEIEVARQKVKDLKSAGERSLALLEERKADVLAKLPEVLAVWIDARLEQEREANTERFRRASDATVTKVKAEVTSLKNRLGPLVARAASVEHYWPHSSGIPSRWGRHAKEMVSRGELPSDVAHSLRQIMGELGAILDSQNLTNGDGWEIIHGDMMGNPTHMRPTKEWSVKGTQEMAEYWEALVQYSENRDATQKAEEQLAKLEAEARWA